jgi:hypothetical protein
MWHYGSFSSGKPGTALLLEHREGLGKNPQTQGREGEEDKRSNLSQWQVPEANGGATLHFHPVRLPAI